MKQYNAIKGKYPGAILLFRVGDFYETFGEDAIRVSEVLGITLTHRNNGSASEIELAGFPHHSLDAYLPRLVRAGLRVAVCDQLEDPKQAKGIVKRGVTELVTPGVTVNDKLLDSRTANYLAAITLGKEEAGVAFAEVSTGEFFCVSADFNRIEKLLGAFRPSEILVSRADMRNFQARFGEKWFITRREDWSFEESTANSRLCAHFNVHSLKSFGIERDALCIRSSGAILQYLEDSQQSHLHHITSIYRFTDQAHVWLDPFTVRNLELVQAMHPEGTCLADILDDTRSPMGARLIRRWILFPLTDKEAIIKRHEVVEALIAAPELASKIRGGLEKTGDIERLLSRLATFRAQPRDLVALFHALDHSGPMRFLLQESNIPPLRILADRLLDVSAPHAILQRTLDLEHANLLTHGHVIRNGVHPELDELRGLATQGKDVLSAIQTREAERTGISSLKVAYNKVFGYYIEITHAHRNKVPDDYIRKQTLTNAERYITPELKEYEEKILNAEERISVLEAQLYQELLSALQPSIPDILNNARVWAEVDVLCGFANTAVRRNYVRPELTDDPILEIQGGRHPVIEAILPPGESYIPNDVFMDPDLHQIMVITGPNMAGKSAVLRQTALIALLAQIGSYVPADSLRMGIVDRIFTRVGASDNLSAGESTFMVEMQETARILHYATDRSLVLMDEIGRGTSTYDGVSIAWSLVEYLHETAGKRAKTLFATHYHELNELASRFPRVRNFNVSVRDVDGRILFLRKLEPGGSNHSFGIHVAELAGMPRQILDRSRELLAHFEQHRLQDNHAAASIKFSARKEIQLNMFELKDADTLKIRQLLSGVDIDRMTPVEALLKLQALKVILMESEV